MLWVMTVMSPSARRSPAAAFIAPVVAAALLLTGVATAAPMMGVGSIAAPARDALVLRASVAAGITPGTSVPVRLTASNAGSATAAISTVRLVGIAADARHAACVTDDFAMTDVAQKAAVPAGARDYPLSGGTLTFKNTDVSQDGCKAATLTLTLSSTGA
jgi:hypothetical protein